VALPLPAKWASVASGPISTAAATSAPVQLQTALATPQTVIIIPTAVGPILAVPQHARFAHLARTTLAVREPATALA